MWRVGSASALSYGLLSLASGGAEECISGERVMDGSTGLHEGVRLARLFQKSLGIGICSTGAPCPGQGALGVPQPIGGGREIAVEASCPLGHERHVRGV